MSNNEQRDNNDNLEDQWREIEEIIDHDDSNSDDLRHYELRSILQDIRQEGILTNILLGQILEAIQKPNHDQKATQRIKSQSSSHQF